MPRPRPWTGAESTQLKQLHAAGGTVTSIAKDLADLAPPSQASQNASACDGPNANKPRPPPPPGSRTRETTIPNRVWAEYGVHTMADIDRVLGREITEPGYMSTTRNPEPPRDYLAERLGERLTLQMAIPQGVGALWLRSISVKPDDDELLLQRGTTYQLISAPQWDEASQTW